MVACVLDVKGVGRLEHLEPCEVDGLLGKINMPAAKLIDRSKRKALRLLCHFVN